MLKSLSIKNYALIDDLSVSFNNGLSIITGETGAGKSILVGGLSLILGKRADISVVKDVSKKCVIEAAFDVGNYNLKTIFNENEIDYETETIIRREILPSGKSRAFINDSPVNLNQLSIISGAIIDIHSQHQTLELTQNNFQFEVIDSISNNINLIEDYKNYLDLYNVKQKELEELIANRDQLIKTLDYNLFLVNEIESSSILSESLEALEQDQRNLANFNSIKEELVYSQQLLSDEKYGLITIMTNLKNSLKRLSESSNSYSILLDRFSSTLIEVDDISNEIENNLENLEENPGKLEEINSKLSSIHNLFRKHSVTRINELEEIYIKLNKSISTSENIDKKIEDTKGECEELMNKLNSKAEVIHNNRKDTIPTFISKIEEIIHDLGMKDAKFKIDINKQETFFSNGKDLIEFLFTANTGSDYKLLKQSASGGELSRIMLAIKSILANYRQLPTLMFDEIDTGVSGEISQKIGNIMKQMSRKMQIFTITHLPQIAAKGESHYKVLKTQEKGETITNMVKLNTQERVVEIATMLEGDNISSSAVAHAKQLLN
ncbi:MAG: DNA repair protein RecN [Flavobacteriaceae bacterium]|nr:DNA repair protein RecN [Flavobacteriaceae bacterium]MBT4112446.1 DNA repair protein RecN [Flavobacteriaceae bacterium]MBT4614300.1 DNA repair protein RecN [Flavobacteriaceae bacterium]MBT5246753.1 DNA repair protein RecN [Flavobacteriaceae bacterium]MBT5649938.1 DNA repair protein RecN [Flavobacteriaceae bacterium]